MNRAAQNFRVPQNLSLLDQVGYCKTIIQKLRFEQIPLREKAAVCDATHNTFIDSLKEWRSKYQKKHQENKQLEKDNEKLRQENDKLRKENHTLKDQLEAKIKTTNTLSQALFLHGNFKKQTPGQKKSGGQPGHKDTNQDKKRDYSSFQKKRVFAAHCGHCGKLLPRVKGYKAKLFIDILVNTKLVQLLLESERQWCTTCRREVNARFPQSLPFTEYGLNAFMVILILRFRGNASAQTTAEILKYCFGLQLSASVVLNLLEQSTPRRW